MKIKKFLITFVAFCIIAAPIWIAVNFDYPNFEQIIYQIQFGMNGVVDTDKEVILNFIFYCIVLPLITAITITYDGNFFNRIAKAISYLLAKPFIMLGLATLFALIQIGLPNFILQRISNEDYFSNNYVYPKNVELTKRSKPKNLILIYVESLENTFAKNYIFEENLLDKLSQENIGGESFKNYRQVLGAHWTIAAIVSTQCGIPLRSVLFDKGGLEFANQIVPNARCLGDVLKDNGYENIFINSINLRFNGTGLFFKNHGYNELYGIDEILAQGFKPKEINKNWPALYDEDLFRFSKAIIDEKERSGSPYNLTILTMDTHNPEGYRSSSCGYKDRSKLARSVLCTSDSLAEFLDYIKKKSYLKNTEVVILGDHLFMANGSMKKKYFFHKERSIFNRFISTNELIPNREEILPFDMFPTILYNLGFEAPDGRLGLGFSGFGEYKIKPNENRYKEMADKLLNYSSKYQEFWKKD